MRWLRGELLIEGRLVRGALAIDGPRIAEVILGAPADDIERRGQPVVDGAIVAPGFIDLQINGGFGLDVAEDGVAAAERLCARLPSTGVTSFLPTLISSAAEVYSRAAALSSVVGAARPGRATALGLHLEGPLLAPTRAGAHPRGAIEAAAGADAAVEALVAAGLVRLVTLAPERPGALARCRELVGRGVAVSLGHTEATHDELRAGVDAGAVLVTHLYNAMSPFHHRAPGAVGAALTDERVAVGLIADGVHGHPAALRLALAAKGADRIALVTDAIAAMGMPPGTWSLGAARVHVDGVTCRLADGTPPELPGTRPDQALGGPFAGGTLAGSVVTLDRAVRVMVEAGATRAQALTMASTVPARLLGLAGKGRLEAGADADVVLLDESMQVVAALVGGQEAPVTHGSSPG
jgi:N-acetylglucosamine-6-phosphate deacetylase